MGVSSEQSKLLAPISTVQVDISNDAPIASGDQIQQCLGRLQAQINNILNGQLLRRYVWYQNDFTFRTTGSNDMWLNAVTSGAGAAVTPIAASTNHIGIVSCTTGTTASGMAGVLSADNALHRGVNDVIYCEGIIRLPTLSDATNSYTIYVGLVGGTTGDPSNGCYFRYTHSVNGGRFECVTRRLGVETASNSGIVVAANTWYRLRVIVSLVGLIQTATFFIGNTQVASVGTNVPFNYGEAFGFGFRINKSAGTTARTMEVDAIALHVAFGTLR